MAVTCAFALFLREGRRGGGVLRDNRDVENEQLFPVPRQHSEQRIAAAHLPLNYRGEFNRVQVRTRAPSLGRGKKRTCDGPVRRVDATARGEANDQ